MFVVRTFKNLLQICWNNFKQFIHLDLHCISRQSSEWGTKNCSRELSRVGSMVACMVLCGQLWVLPFTRCRSCPLTFGQGWSSMGLPGQTLFSGIDTLFLTPCSIYHLDFSVPLVRRNPQRTERCASSDFTLLERHNSESDSTYGAQQWQHWDC